jgi:hypothetical protein
MRKVSKKREPENREYRILRAVFLLTHPECFVCGKTTPFAQRQLHHYYGRTGRLLTWQPGFRMACRHCHEWIETHRNVAADEGYRAGNKIFNRPSLVIP